MASGSYLIHEFLRLLYHQCDVLLRLTPLNVLFVRLTVSSKFQFKKNYNFLENISWFRLYRVNYQNNIKISNS